MFPLYEKLFSAARMSRYLAVALTSPDLAVQLYEANLRLSQALYSPLAILEVALRNQLSAALAAHFQQADWLIAQQAGSGFMRDRRFQYRSAKTGKVVVNDFLLRSVQSAEKKIPGQPTQNALLAELMFGFWTEMFDKTPFKILQGVPLNVFVNKPAAVNRVDIFNRLTAVRKLRNRVYHYEPICLQQHTACLNDVRVVHREIIELCTWLSPDLPDVVGRLDRFESTCQTICQELPFITP